MHRHTRFPNHFIRHSAAIATAIVGAGVISACSSDSAGLAAKTQSQIAFMTMAAAAGNVASASTTPITVGAHTLDLTQVTLTIDRAELKRAHTDACEGDHDESDDHSGAATTTNTSNCAEVKIGPTSVDLPLTPGLVTLPANAIPAGTFREFALSVSEVRLRGTYDAKAFDVLLPVRVRQEIEFATPLVVTEGTPASITVSVPVNEWFINTDGSLVDPNAILTTPSVLEAVRARIAASFRAFEDDNHDGKDDHGDHG